MPNINRFFVISAFVLVALLLLACQPLPPVPPEPASEEPGLRSPGPSPVDLTWDGQHLWVVDDETRSLYRLSVETGESVRALQTEVKQPRGIAWDGESLWVIDAAEGAIFRFDPVTGEQIGAVQAPKPEIEGDWALTGLAWDGKYLWVPISAGWCSTMNRVDPDTGEIIDSFFPQCDPRGLATDGQHVWTIAYNGPELPSRLSQRLLSEEPAKKITSQEFLSDLPVQDPAGLTLGKDVLWTIDRSTGRIVPIQFR